MGKRSAVMLAAILASASGASAAPTMSLISTISMQGVEHPARSEEAGSFSCRAVGAAGVAAAVNAAGVVALSAAASIAITFIVTRRTQATATRLQTGMSTQVQTGTLMSPRIGT